MAGLEIAADPFNTFRSSPGSAVALRQLRWPGFSGVHHDKGFICISLWVGSTFSDWPKCVALFAFFGDFVAFTGLGSAG